jgi:3-keto-5-aminohexanoate cleavage enzyme
MKKAVKKLIINLAPTGIIPTKEMTEYVPITPEEIARDVCACQKWGVSMVHLHARDAAGKPTYQKEVYARIIAQVREKCPDLILIVSTSGRVFNEFEKRAEVLELSGDEKPQMASLTLSSLNFVTSASVNQPDIIMRLAAKMREKGIKPELEFFDLGMVNYTHYLIKKDILSPPYYFNILLGNIASAQARLTHLGLMTSELPPKSYWSAGGIGDSQKWMTSVGVTAADGVRIGLEDQIWWNEARTRKATNEDLVKRIHNLAQVLERPLATPQEVRALLGLS